MTVQEGLTQWVEEHYPDIHSIVLEDTAEFFRDLYCWFKWHDICPDCSAEGRLFFFVSRFSSEIGCDVSDVYDILTFFTSVFDMFTYTIVPACDNAFLNGEEDVCMQKYVDFAMIINKHTPNWESVLRAFFVVHGVTIFSDVDAFDEIVSITNAS